jgi:hypothetical protein
MDTPAFVYSCKFVDGYPDPEGAFKRLLEGLESLKKEIDERRKRKETTFIFQG